VKTITFGLFVTRHVNPTFTSPNVISFFSLIKRVGNADYFLNILTLLTDSSLIKQLFCYVFFAMHNKNLNIKVLIVTIEISGYWRFLEA